MRKFAYRREKTFGKVRYRLSFRRYKRRGAGEDQEVFDKRRGQQGRFFRPTRNAGEGFPRKEEYAGGTDFLQRYGRKGAERVLRRIRVCYEFRGLTFRAGLFPQGRESSHPYRTQGGGHLLERPLPSYHVFDRTQRRDFPLRQSAYRGKLGTLQKDLRRSLRGQERQVSLSYGYSHSRRQETP